MLLAHAGPHSSTLLKDAKVWVTRIELAPGEASALHTYPNPYAYISLADTRVSNEVPGQRPVVVDAAAGELHTSKGGFSVVQRNVSNAPATLIVIERLGAPATPFPIPSTTSKCKAPSKACFSKAFPCASFEVTLGAAGRILPRAQAYDELLFASTDAGLSAGDSRSTLKPGDVKWLASGSNETIENAAGAPASVIVFDLN